jgi:hypothetical protein
MLSGFLMPRMLSCILMRKISRLLKKGLGTRRKQILPGKGVIRT